MKKIILILATLMVWNIAWCSQIGIGVDASRVVIWEYWKFSNGKEGNELMVYNPMDSSINVVFRKWYQKKEGEPDRIYTEGDVLLRIKRLNSNNYALFETATTEIRGLHKGLIEVLVNGKSAGLYDILRKIEPPKAKIKNGIIINQISNSGGALQYEIIYEDLQFKKNKSHRARIEYLKEDFYSSGFIKGEKFNPNNIGLKDISVLNVNLGTKENFDLSLVSTGKLGSFEVTFTNLRTKQKILQRNFNHMVNKGTGQTIAFNIPNRICFNKKKKYRKRK